MTSPTLPVFTRPGDACAEVDRLVAELGGAAAAGLHRSLYVSRADSTVVMATARDVPLANALRGLAGWVEPVE